MRSEVRVPRRVRHALASACAVVLLSASAGCSIGGSGSGSGSRSGSGEPEPQPSASGGPTTPSATEACAEVRAGIDAFNDADYEETVARFEAAVPLAEEQAEEDDSRRAALLLEAVRWYAELPAEDYPEASLTSEDFARYKQITLGQCAGAPGKDREGEPSDGVPV